MATATKAKAQIGLEDQWLEDQELNDLLEERQAKMDEISATLAAIRHLGDQTRARAETLAFEGKRRVGRFVLSRVHVPAKEVESFTTKAKTKIQFGLAKVEE